MKRGKKSQGDCSKSRYKCECIDGGRVGEQRASLGLFSLKNGMDGDLGKTQKRS